jgi:hypothetical protein
MAATATTDTHEVASTLQKIDDVSVQNLVVVRLKRTQRSMVSQQLARARNFPRLHAFLTANP